MKADAEFQPPRLLPRAWWNWPLVLLLAGLARSSSGADPVDLSQLPPPATAVVDFAQDIRPILENSCLRCHGPQRPKGKFRLDSRAAALKGGVNGVAILPGQSAQSPLIQFVAHLVPDAEMPPPGKGEPLTDEQIALLRAWIDQGVPWDDGDLKEKTTLTLTPVIGGTAVDGDERKFRAHYGRREGLDGGGDFDSFHPLDADTRLRLTGHARVDDYRTTLSLEKHEVGFIRAGFEQYTRYYDDTGGYRPRPTTPIAPSLGRDLQLDIGRAWFDLGLTLPDWPRMVLGYEYDFKRGDKSLTAWSGAGTGVDSRSLAPVSKSLDEGVHIIKFDLEAEVRGVTIEERFRGEFYSLDTHYTNTSTRGPVTQDVREHTEYFQGANSVRVEKPLKDWWLASAGYFYSKLEGEGTFSDSARLGGLVRVATVPEITVERETHVFNVNSLFGPRHGVSLTTGVQGEWTRERGVGGGMLHQIPFVYQLPTTLATNPASLFAESEANTFAEFCALRLGWIPHTTLFAEARLEQQDSGRSDSDLQPSGGNFLEHIDSHRQSGNLRLGANTSPWEKVLLSSHWRRYTDSSDYYNEVAPQPAGSYPGFVRAREVNTDEFELRLTLRPARWLKAALAYQHLQTDSMTDTRVASNAAGTLIYSPGGVLLASQYDAHVYSAGLTLTPWRRLYLNATFSWQNSTARTADKGVAALAPYQGNVYSLLLNGSYVLTASADVFAVASYSEADYAQANAAAGLPLGIRYRQLGAEIGVRRRFSGKFSTQLQAGFYKYDEPTSGGANDYIAFSLFGAVNIYLP